MPPLPEEQRPDETTELERFRLFFDYANDAKFIHGFNPDGTPGRFIEVNRTACERLGYSREELLQLSPGDIDALDPDGEGPLTPERVTAGTTFVFEMVHLARSGEAIPVEISSHIVDIGGELSCISIARDLRERKRNESALNEAERLQASMLETVPSAVFYKRRDGAYLGCNSAFSDMFGLTPADVVGKTVFDLVPEHEARVFHEQDEALFEAGGVQAYESSFTDGSAQVREVLFNKAVFTGPHGEVLGLVGVATDITERKTFERELQQSHLFLQRVIDSLAAHIAIIDADGVILAVNEAWRSFGEQNDLKDNAWSLGQNYLAVVDRSCGDWSEEAPAVSEGLRELIAGGRDDFEIEYPCHSPEQKRWYLMRASRLHDDEAGRVVVAHMDITKRRLAEEELRQAGEHIAQVHKVLPSALFTVDIQRRITSWNDRAAQVTGYSAEEMIGRHCSTFALDPCAHGCGLFSGERTAPVVGRECTIRRSDGQERIIEKNAAQLRTAEGELIGGIECFEDVTDRRTLEESLRQSEKMKAIGQLAGGIAHDFNNQLAGIIGYADLLINSLADRPALKRYAEMVLRGANRSADLNRQLLAFARKGAFLIRPVDMHEMIEELSSLLEHTIDRRISIHKTLRAPTAVVDGDPSQLQNALLNLALNARDALPEGGEIRIATDVVKLTEPHTCSPDDEIPPGAYLVLEVIDNGTGIDEEVCRHVFEPFYTTRQEDGGTGMGLAGVYGTMKSHHGAVEVESAPGRGSTFRIYLPLGAGKQHDAVEEMPPQPGHGHILVVDDEDLVRMLAEDILQTLGYTVTACEDGLEAVEIYRRIGDEIDLVILDMIMPQMGGAQTFDALRAIDPAVRVLISSGYSLEGEAKSLLARGVFGLIEKPFHIAALSTAIAEALPEPDDG